MASSGRALWRHQPFSSARACTTQSLANAAATAKAAALLLSTLPPIHSVHTPNATSSMRLPHRAVLARLSIAAVSPSPSPTLLPLLPLLHHRLCLCRAHVTRVFMRSRQTSLASMAPAGCNLCGWVIAGRAHRTGSRRTILHTGTRCPLTVQGMFRRLSLRTLLPSTCRNRSHTLYPSSHCCFFFPLLF